MPAVIALISGIVFGAGLTLSDMVNPARVMNFFDVAGTWDGTLLFVMGGALATTLIGYRLVFRRGAPLWNGSFHLPQLTAIDLPLVGGAALFGLGWGLGGFCPGPALAALVSMEPRVWVFVGTMLSAMVATRLLRNRLKI